MNTPSLSSILNPLSVLYRLSLSSISNILHTTICLSQRFLKKGDVILRVRFLPEREGSQRLLQAKPLFRRERLANRRFFYPAFTTAANSTADCRTFFPLVFTLASDFSYSGSRPASIFRKSAIAH